MPSRILPNLGIKGFYDVGENGWGAELSASLLKLSVLAQATALSRLAAVPGAPADGDIHVLTAGPNANAIAVYDDGAWVYYEPVEGWWIYDRGANTFLQFNGAAWAEFAGGGGGGLSAEQVMDTVAALLAEGTNINITYNDAGDILTIDGLGGGGGGSGAPWYFDPPAIADFTTTAGAGSALIVTEDADAGLLVETDGTGFNYVKALLQVPPQSVNWRATMRFDTIIFDDPASAPGVGIVMYNAAKNLCYHWSVDGREPWLHIARFNAGGYDGFEAFSLKLSHGVPNWLRFAYIAATDNVHCQTSSDGKIWHMAQQTWINNTLGANNVGPAYVGPGIRCENYPRKLGMSIQHWDVETF